MAIRWEKSVCSPWHPVNRVVTTETACKIAVSRSLIDALHFQVFRQFKTRACGRG